jgi:hypothetical protein
MDKMIIQILQLNNMVATKEFNKQNADKDKEQAIIEVNELKQEIHKTKAKLDHLLERRKDLDLTYVKKTIRGI